MTASHATPLWVRSLREWVEENTGAAVAFAIIFHLAVSAFAATVIAGSTSDAREVTRDYQMLVGDAPPEEFFPVASGRFVGRQFVFLQHFGGQAMIVVVAEGWIAGRSSPEERMRFAESLLDVTEIPWEEVGTDTGNIGPQPVQLRHLSVGPKESPLSMYLSTFTAPNKDTCTYALISPEDDRQEMRKGVFGEY